MKNCTKKKYDKVNYSKVCIACGNKILRDKYSNLIRK